MRQTLLVALGGMLGSVARFWLSGLVQRLGASAFPLGTLAVNVTGSLLLGVVMARTLEAGASALPLRILLGAGFCGGFTTMSTFAYETMALAHDTSAASAVGNVALTLGLSLAGVWIGFVAGRTS